MLKEEVMKTYSKLKMLPTNVFLYSAIIIVYSISIDDILFFFVTWITAIFLMIVIRFTTYKIDVSSQQIKIYKLFRRPKVVDLQKVSRIKLKNDTLMKRWLVMSLYEENKLILSAEVYALINEGLDKTLMYYAAMNSYVIEFD